MTRSAAHGRLAVPLALWLVLQIPASAANITVTGNCDLVEAIQNANDSGNGQPNLDCAAGDPAGPDRVILTSDVSLTTAYGSGRGLPTVFTEMTIEGNGYAIARNSVEEFRIFDVSPSGDLTLENTTVGNGGGSTFYYGGSGISNQGTLTLSHSTVTGGRGTGSGGGI